MEGQKTDQVLFNSNLLLLCYHKIIYHIILDKHRNINYIDIVFLTGLLSMINIYKPKTFLFLLFLLSIVIINYNIIANGHFHLDENGLFNFHAHPYSKGNDNLPFYPKHKHTQIELIYLTQIIHFLCFIFIFLFILFIPTKKRWYFNNKILTKEEGEGENGVLIVTKEGKNFSISVPEIDKIIGVQIN